MDKKDPTERESKITGDIHGSPEYLPPSAKIKRLASKETPSVDEGCSNSSVCHELLNSQAARTANKEITGAEKLNSIREQEEKIEQMLVLLESSVKRSRGRTTLLRSFLFSKNKKFMSFYATVEIRKRSL